MVRARSWEGGGLGVVDGRASGGILRSGTQEKAGSNVERVLAMDLPAFLTSAPKPVSPMVRLGFLALCAGLLVGHVAWLGRHSWAFHDDRHRIVALVLVAFLFNHLAFRFAWPRPVTIALRVGATLWLLLLGACWLLAVYR